MSQPISSLPARGHVSWFFRSISWVMIILFSLFTIVPLVWMTVTSFKPHREIARDILAWPKAPTVGNFVRAWDLGDFGWLFANSVGYSLVTTIATVLLALSVGYAFAWISSRLTPFLYGFIVLGLLITVHSTLIPLFVIENAFGLDNTRLGILIPYVAFALPFAVYLATTFIKAIPEDVMSASAIDGANHAQIFWHIILPICRPIAATIAIFTFLSAWNEFVLVFTLTSDTHVQTLPVGINALAGGRNVNYGLQFASLVIGTVPMILFYTLFHRQLHAGFAQGAIKG